jgi:hypothetical protein
MPDFPHFLFFAAAVAGRLVSGGATAAASKPKPAAGYLSRFILTEHSPLETVAHLRPPRVIVFDGEVFKTTGTGEDKGSWNVRGRTSLNFT